jgi:pilus assembly protein FimV
MEELPESNANIVNITDNVIAEDITETPLDVIEELDDVDFDELLANIEEETANYPEDEAVEYEFEDIGDDLITVDSGVEIPSESEALDANKDYVSVDDLLTESLEEAEVSEPYEKTNIDVGLGQFAENEAGIDVDEDGSVSSKLDLAKMYIQMSDEENAQVILQEVIEKGDGVQQAEAKSLLDTL